jgi:hypothetical protein
VPISMAPQRHLGERRPAACGKTYGALRIGRYLTARNVALCFSVSALTKNRRSRLGCWARTSGVPASPRPCQGEANPGIARSSPANVLVVGRRESGDAARRLRNVRQRLPQVRFCCCCNGRFQSAPQQVPAHLLLPQSHAQLQGDTVQKVQKEALGSYYRSRRIVPRR